MKTIIFLSVVFSSGLIFSQKTIIKNDFPTANSVMDISTSTNFSVDYSSTGAGITWDFSNLSENSQTTENTYDITSGGPILSIQFGLFAAEKYRATYFTPYDGLPISQISNYLPISIESVNLLVKVADDKVTHVGYSLEVEGTQVGFRSDVIETAYELPLNYGDTYTSYGYTKMDFNPFYDGMFIQHRFRSSEVDGYGNLITPYGFYEDVIKVRHTIEEQDSILFSIDIIGFPVQQWIPINRTIGIYEWWDNGRKRPVLRIETESVFGAEIVNKITYINTDDIDEPDDTDPTSGINELTNFEMSVFPNPAHQFINIKYKEKIDQISIYSLDGKIILQKSGSANNEVLDVSGLSTGLYTLQIKSQNSCDVRSIMIK